MVGRNISTLLQYEHAGEKAVVDDLLVGDQGKIEQVGALGSRGAHCPRSACVAALGTCVLTAQDRCATLPPAACRVR